MPWTSLLMQIAVAMPLLEKGEFAAALPPLEQACRKNEPSGCYLLGRALFSLDRYAKAREVLTNARKGDPFPWRVDDALAMIAEALGEPADALFAKAVKSKEVAPRLHYGQYLIRQGRAEEAVKMLQPLPKDALVRFELGRALYQTGKLREAEAELAASGSEAAALLLAKVRRQLASARP